jgi:hypothetical protein
VLAYDNGVQERVRNKKARPDYIRPGHILIKIIKFLENRRSQVSRVRNEKKFLPGRVSATGLNRRARCTSTQAALALVGGSGGR